MSLDPDWMLKATPPPKATEHGNFRRADWFERRYTELQAKLEQAFKIHNEYKSATDQAIAAGKEIERLQRERISQLMNEIRACRSECVRLSALIDGVYH